MLTTLQQLIRFVDFFDKYYDQHIQQTFRINNGCKATAFVGPDLCGPLVLSMLSLAFQIPPPFCATEVSMSTPINLLMACFVEYRCFFYGDISPKSDPIMYGQNIADLYQHFCNHYHHNGQEIIPLVINTHGWVKGTFLSPPAPPRPRSLQS